MDYASRGELNGVGDRVRTVSENFAACKGEMEARVKAVETSIINIEKCTNSLNKGQSRIYGAVIGINGIIAAIIAVVGVYVTLVK